MYIMIYYDIYTYINIYHYIVFFKATFSTPKDRGIRDSKGDSTIGLVYFVLVKVSNLKISSLDVSKNSGTPKWMVYNGNPY